MSLWVFILASPLGLASLFHLVQRCYTNIPRMTVREPIHQRLTICETDLEMNLLFTVERTDAGYTFERSSQHQIH